MKKNNNFQIKIKQKLPNIREKYKRSVPKAKEQLFFLGGKESTQGVDSKPNPKHNFITDIMGFDH
jgi:hypothetical protein